MEKNLVTSLKLSRELKKLGVKQESEFYWANVYWQDDEYHICKDFILVNEIPYPYPRGKKEEREWNKNIQIYSAFLSGELGEMLPKGEYLETFFHSLEIQLKITIQGCSKVFQGDTEANARAKMLIYLKENKLI